MYIYAERWTWDKKWDIRTLTGVLGVARHLKGHGI
jgi:hypothetical protein